MQELEGIIMKSIFDKVTIDDCIHEKDKIFPLPFIFTFSLHFPASSSFQSANSELLTLEKDVTLHSFNFLDCVSSAGFAFSRLIRTDRLKSSVWTVPIAVGEIEPIRYLLWTVKNRCWIAP